MTPDDPTARLLDLLQVVCDPNAASGDKSAAAIEAVPLVHRSAPNIRPIAARVLNGLVAQRLAQTGRKR